MGWGEFQVPLGGPGGHVGWVETGSVSAVSEGLVPYPSLTTFTCGTWARADRPSASPSPPACASTGVCWAGMAHGRLPGSRRTFDPGLSPVLALCCPFSPGQHVTLVSPSLRSHLAQGIPACPLWGW